MFPLSMKTSVSTFVIVPNPDFPNIAQISVGGDMKDVESVACESSSAVQVAMSAAAFTSIQADSYMSRGA